MNLLELQKEEAGEMNYNSFFGFSDSPFLEELDQRFLFISKQFEQFLGKLTDFVSERRGIALVSGEDGVGKTMLVQALLSRLPSAFHPLIISSPPSEPLAIPLLLAQSLDITLRDRNLVNLTPLAEAVRNASQQEKYFLLVVDDAHVLTDQHLEEIFVLSQMEHQDRQLIPIMLVGRKGLVQKVASQTNQRLQGLIRHNLKLSGLTFEETTQYIDHRLLQVGSSYKACFAEGCSGQLFSRTGGLPRRINQICDQALNRAWQENQTRVTRDLIGGKEPVSASQYKPLVPEPHYSFPARFTAWAAAVLLAGLVGYVAYSNFYSPSLATSPSVADNTVPPPQTSPAPPPEPVVPARSETVPPAPPQDQMEKATAGPLEPVSPEPQVSEENEPPQVLPQAEAPAVSPPEPQAPEAQALSPDTHRVAPEDGGLLRIVAGYYPDQPEIGYNAVILANPEINNEDIIYPGQKLSLPEVNKNNKVITLNNNQHFSIYKQFHSSSQVKQTTDRLQEQGIRYLVRETRLPGAGPIYRIFLGGYENQEDLQAAMAATEKN
jgi:type II secretory pathway predicted ATPase ExeA